MTKTKIANDNTTQQTSCTPPKGEELDSFTSKASKKKKVEKAHPKPQAEETLNPELSSENDI